jgi:hypothetical protein
MRSFSLPETKPTPSGGPTVLVSIVGYRFTQPNLLFQPIWIPAFAGMTD